MNPWKILEEHQKILCSYIDKISKNNYQEVLSHIYNYVKSISDIYYEENQIHDAYKILRRYIIDAENKFTHIRLLDVPIYFDMQDDKDDFIEYIVHSTRKYLIEEHIRFGHYDKVLELDFTNDCRKSAEYIKDLCDDYNVESYILPIHPGYCPEARLYDGAGYHFANIIKYGNKHYLVDVTYSQFFYEKRNNLDRLGVMGMSGCNVGAFMLMADKGKDISTILLQEGYIELNEEVLKNYLDAFTVSFRNGLYYEKTNDFSYTASYSIDDYVSFLQGNDNQINYEGEENLGYQRKPLKNWNLIFKR